jgi:hypothetical protein
MSKRHEHRGEQAMRERLRDEAMADRPAFSAELHDRLCAAVAVERAQRPQAGGRPRRMLAWATVAVAACLTVAAVAWHAGRPSNPTERAEQPEVVRPVDKPRAIAQANESLEPIGDLTGGWWDHLPSIVDETITPHRWAYLDHDGRLTAEMLVAHLPFDVQAALGPSESDTP